MPWGYGDMPLGFVGLLLWLLAIPVLVAVENREIEGKEYHVSVLRSPLLTVGVTVFAVLILFAVLFSPLTGSLSPLLLILVVSLLLGNTVKRWCRQKNTKFLSDAPVVASIMLAICLSGLIADLVPLRGGVHLAVFTAISWLIIIIPLLEVKGNRLATGFFALLNCLIVALLPYGVLRAQAKGTEEARRAACIGDVQRIYRAVEKYKSSHDADFPSPAGWREALEPLMPGYSFTSFHCSFHSSPAECYLYTPPKGEKKDNPVILACHHSKVIFSDPEIIRLRQDGTIEVVRGSPPRVVLKRPPPFTSRGEGN